MIIYIIYSENEKTFISLIINIDLSFAYNINSRCFYVEYKNILFIYFSLFIRKSILYYLLLYYLFTKNIYFQTTRQIDMYKNGRNEQFSRKFSLRFNESSRNVGRDLFARLFHIRQSHYNGPEGWGKITES